MSKPVKKIPEGYHTITPGLTAHDAAAAIDFYKKAFGAVELHRMPGPGGKIMHSELQIGSSRFFVVDEMGMGARSPKSAGGTTCSLTIYVEDADALWNQALKAGAIATMPIANMFWGDRWGSLTDPFGHSWSIATHVEDVSPDEMGKRAAAAMAEMAKMTKK